MNAQQRVERVLLKELGRKRKRDRDAELGRRAQYFVAQCTPQVRVYHSERARRALERGGHGAPVL